MQAIAGWARKWGWRKKIGMCRSIKTLHNFEPPATDEEIRAAALQFVRKLSGFAPALAGECDRLRPRPSIR